MNVAFRRSLVSTSKRTAGLADRTSVLRKSCLFSSIRFCSKKLPEPQSKEGETAVPEAAVPKKVPEGTFAKLKHYGPPAIFIYLTIHCLGFWLMFFLVSAGFPIKRYLAEYMGGDDSVPKGLWAEFALALAVNKLFSPLQALLTLALVPRLAPILTSWGPTQQLLLFVSRFSKHSKK
ncbi:hypothetical protein DIPPA_26842 [Diplonema papillatum]|nr:hypothetical protein DIPPA_26842 [Diplonema papillatum]